MTTNDDRNLISFRTQVFADITVDRRAGTATLTVDLRDLDVDFVLEDTLPDEQLVADVHNAGYGLADMAMTLLGKSRSALSVTMHSITGSM